MITNTKDLVLSAIQQTLKMAEHQVNKSRPIANLNSESLRNQIFRDMEERQIINGDNNIYWITMFIESPYDLNDSLELSDIITSVEGGSDSGFGTVNYSEGQGQYLYCVVEND